MSQHCKKYNLAKMVGEFLGLYLGGLVTEQAYSWKAPTPLLIPGRRAELERCVANALATRLHGGRIQTVVPTGPPTSSFVTTLVDGEPLIDPTDVEGVAGDPSVVGLVEELGRLLSDLAVEGLSLGDTGWSNALLVSSGDSPSLALCDYEHAAGPWPWPASAKYLQKRSNPDSWWPADDLYEGVVTTCIMAPPCPPLWELFSSFARGVASHREIAYAVARLFSLRQSSSYLRASLSRFSDSRGKDYRVNFLRNYPVAAQAFRESIELPSMLHSDLSRVKSWLGRGLGRLWGNEYGHDANAYHSYSRIFEDRDGVAVRTLLTIAEPPDEPRRTVLDIGAGTGLIGGTIAICRPKWSVTLLDRSEEQLSLARKCYGERVITCLGDMESIPFENEWFDYVIAASAIRYADDPAKVADEISRVLRPRGRLVVLPTDFSKVNAVLYGRQSLRSEENLKKLFLRHRFKWVDSVPLISVRRGMRARPLHFERLA